MTTYSLLRCALFSLAFCFQSVAMEAAHTKLDDAFFERCKKLGQSPNNFMLKGGITALMLACKDQQVPFVKKLIQGVNFKINAQDHEENTALHYATISGNKEIVAMLLSVPEIEAGLKNKEGKSAYEAAYYQAAKTFNDNEAQKLNEIMEMLLPKSKL